MRTNLLKIGGGAFLFLFLLSCNDTESPDLTHEFVAVASKTEAIVSIIDIDTDEVVKTEVIGNGSSINDIEFVVRHRKLFLSDQANNRILVYDPHAFVLDKSIRLKGSVADIEADKVGRNLWAVHPSTQSISVIDVSTQSKYKDIRLNSDLIAMGARPSKVMLSPEGEYAYILNTVDGQNTDILISYDTESFTQLASEKVGKQAILHFSGKSNQLYALSSISDRITVLQPNLSVETEIDLPMDRVLGINTRGSHIFTAKGNTVFAMDVESLGTEEVFSGNSTPSKITTDFYDHKAFISFPDENKVEILSLGDNRADMTLRNTLEVRENPSALKFFSIPGACAYHGHADFYANN